MKKPGMERPPGDTHGGKSELTSMFIPVKRDGHHHDSYL
jgi:hypothetical protein